MYPKILPNEKYDVISFSRAIISYLSILSTKTIYGFITYPVNARPIYQVRLIYIKVNNNYNITILHKYFVYLIRLGQIRIPSFTDL